MSKRAKGFALSNVRNFVFNGSRGMNHPLNNYLKIRNFGEIDKFFRYYLQGFFGIIESKSCRLKHFNGIRWYYSCVGTLLMG